MTEKLSKDSTKILEDLSRPYGCYGIKTTQGMGVWCDEWLKNEGDPHCLQGLLMITNTETGCMTLWLEQEVIKDER